MIIPCAWYIVCKCGEEDIESPSGSLMWTAEEMKGQTIACPRCGNQIKVPDKHNVSEKASGR